MDPKTIISVIAIILVIVGYLPYIKDTIKGKTRPHAFSFFLWSLITFVVFALQIKNGGGAGSWITFFLGFIIFLTFILSLKNGKRDIRNIDYVFLILTLIAISLWVFVDQPVLSIILLSVTDMLAFGPTIRKSWVDPYSETLSLYTITAVRHVLAIVALSQINIVTVLFPLTWVIANIFFSIMLIYRRKQIPLPK
jgi:hypothetical protein